ncbi:MAG: dihydropteroate synthase, partial [Candidatus Thermoplasmatota archaeon]
MKNIRLKELKNLEEVKKELTRIGSDKIGIELMAPKAIHKIVKIEDLDSKAANILKQEMLSVGGECAIAKSAITLKCPTTDALLMATLKQYNKVISKLVFQPFGLKELGEKLKYLLETPRPKAIKIGSRKFQFGTRTYIMGILNITPDSFSGDGILDSDRAVERAKTLEEQGADIIDVGGESSRPFSKPVSLEEELERVIPVIKKLTSRVNIPISIDTYKSKVAKRALELGADMVNDISALRMDKKMSLVVANHRVPIVLMHMKGTPRTMQIEPVYKDVIGEIYSFLNERIEFAVSKKIEKENIIVDPGIG